MIIATSAMIDRALTDAVAPLFSSGSILPSAGLRACRGDSSVYGVGFARLRQPGRASLVQRPSTRLAAAAFSVATVAAMSAVAVPVAASAATQTVVSFSWNTKDVAKGTHKLTAVVTDAAGNSTPS